jgi:hypothetical protein
LFDKYFKDVRAEIKSVDNKYKSLFKTMKINIYNTFTNLYGFMDYFKLVISKEKFIKITNVLNSKKMNKINNDDIDEDDSLRPEKIIEKIDLKSNIKRKLELANEIKESVKKEFQNNETLEDHNENIALAFSLDPLQLIVNRI